MPWTSNFFAVLLFASRRNRDRIVLEHVHHVLERFVLVAIVDRDHLQMIRTDALHHAGQHGQFLLAWPAPRGPERHDDHLAVIVADADLVALEVLAELVFGNASDRQGWPFALRGRLIAESPAPPDKPASASIAPTARAYALNAGLVRFSWPPGRATTLSSMRTPPKVLELRHSLPVDHFSDGLRFRFVQQLVDEVEPGLHGHHETVLELAREPQERMVVRPLDLLAVRRSRCSAAHVVHLQS